MRSAFILQMFYVKYLSVVFSKGKQGASVASIIYNLITYGYKYMHCHMCANPRHKTFGFMPLCFNVRKRGRGKLLWDRNEQLTLARRYLLYR